MTPLEIYAFAAPAAVTTICLVAVWWQRRH
jgi:hypothetical protein